MKEITGYLLKTDVLNQDCVRGDSLFEKDPRLCRKRLIEEAFELGENFLSCQKFDQVTEGEGKEKEKITTLYSSSLQSLLVFTRVSKDRPIVIDDVKYTSSYFEYKNKVLSRPSCIDVVLTSEDKNTILFLESKLYEPVRDSREGTGGYEVGPSYLSNDENGYFKKLGLTAEDLENLGFDLAKVKGIYGKESPSKIKAHLKSEASKSGNCRIDPRKGRSFVYSYGIKQTLSHLIGILNFAEPNENCSSYLKEGFASAERRYLLVYNALPGFEKKEKAEEKLKDFEDHVLNAYEILRSPLKGKIEMGVKTYQDLYEANKNYFEEEGMKNIASFYHLDGKHR